MTKDEKEIDNLLKNSFTLTDEEKVIKKNTLKMKIFVHLDKIR